MATTLSKQNQIKDLKKRFVELTSSNSELNNQISISEIYEIIYNSNAIENSTISLLETIDIIDHNFIKREVDLREIYEVKNLAKVMNNLPPNTKLSKDTILDMHRNLMLGIDDEIAGRFRRNKEYVRVGSHLAPPPERVENLIENAINEYNSDDKSYILDKVAKFHLEFEFIHPFVDGNGRVGRVLVNMLLNNEGFPSIIIKDKGKEEYYKCFSEYDVTLKTKRMDDLIFKNVLEALHKRIVLLSKSEYMKISEYSKINKSNLNALLNKAKRQTIPAFRMKGVWYIEKKYVC